LVGRRRKKILAKSREQFRVGVDTAHLGSTKVKITKKIKRLKLRTAIDVYLARTILQNLKN
jgi:hypothetical protein